MSQCSPKRICQATGTIESAAIAAISRAPHSAIHREMEIETMGKHNPLAPAGRGLSAAILRPSGGAPAQVAWRRGFGGGNQRNLLYRFPSPDEAVKQLRATSPRWGEVLSLSRQRGGERLDIVAEHVESGARRR